MPPTETQLKFGEKQFLGRKLVETDLPGGDDGFDDSSKAQMAIYECLRSDRHLLF